MTRATQTRLILALLVLGETFMAESSYGADPIQTVHRLDKKVDVGLNYLLYLPPDFERQQAWPMILFLHGSGERAATSKRSKQEGLPEMIEHLGRNSPSSKCVSPQCPEGDAWTWRLESLSALIDEAIARYKVDPDRIYLTGLSMGGFGTWALATYTPDRFAAIIPICGGGELTSVRRLKNLPVWAFHGAKDPIVPIARTQELVDALTKAHGTVAHGTVKFTIYPEAQHDSWTATYDNPEIYKWLLEQKRAPQPKKSQ